MRRAAFLLLLAMAGCGGDGDGRTTSSTPTAEAVSTPAPSRDDAAVRTAATDYLDSAWRGDERGMCRLSTRGERRKQGGFCDMVRRHGGRVEALPGDPPAVETVRVTGDTAFAKGADGISVTLLRERGGWFVDEARGMPERTLVTERS